MPKTFDYKDSKEIVKYYEKILFDLKESQKISNEYKNDLLKYINNLHNCGYFNQIIKEEIENGTFDLNSEKFSNLLTKIYLYKECLNVSNECMVLYNSNSSYIENCINLLSVSKNSIKWLFSSKQKKSDAESAYNELLDLKNKSFIINSNQLFERLTKIKETEYNEILHDYQIDKISYKDFLKSAQETIFEDYGKVKIFKILCDGKRHIDQKIDEINETLISTKIEVKKALDRLVAEELVQQLRQIPIEELSKDKSGIKTKYLRDAGYDNLATILAASLEQISSIYGISRDKAYTIKSKADNYALNLKKMWKIKLSVDDKTPITTKIIQSLYKYLQQKSYINKIEDLNLNNTYRIDLAFDELNYVGNGLKWLFFTDLRKQKVKESYEFLNENFNSKYKIKFEEIYEDYKKMNIDLINSWNDFQQNSIKYYNAIEEIYPGLLGNDDSIYGLPEELARQVQEECFFPDGLLCILRKYQEWGVKYILHQEKVLLGDEMGLGKTIQAIATMVSLKNTGATHFLVICPASVLTNWCREITKQSKLQVIKIHGSGKSSLFKSWIKTGGVAVTNYESTSSIKFDENYKISLIVVDEAHYIKNSVARRSINTKEITNHADRLLFMTGTALENNVEEMITLINMLRPNIANQIKNVAYISSAPQFREKIASVYYRRKREDVLTELPDKEEIKEWCILNNEEEKIYEEDILSKKYQDARRVSWSIDDLSKSSKANRLKEIVEEAKKEERKILVFSFYLDTIYKIHDFLKGQCLNPITGSVNLNRRQEIIDEFDKSGPGTVLLAQINSGGTGLNIQSASVVVICEPQLKPSIENQAISRAYRMGQTRKVLVYRLLCDNTIDEKLIKTLEEKQAIFDAFADKSVAAKAEVEIDDKKLGEIIKEEIDRINEKRKNQDNEVKNDFDKDNDEI